jgi:hypothetical protein
MKEKKIAVLITTDNTKRGVLGLASMGPSKSCRISKAVKRATLQGVTAAFYSNR